MRARHGFTLLEMIVVLVIASLVIAVGAASVASIGEEHELRKASLEVERIFMTAAHRATATSAAQVIVFDDKGLGFAGGEAENATNGQYAALPPGAKLTLRRLGAAEFAPAPGQRVFLRAGGLCEPLGLRFDLKGATLTATLDPLTGGLLDVTENFYR